MICLLSTSARVVASAGILLSALLCTHAPSAAQPGSPSGCDPSQIINPCEPDPGTSFRVPPTVSLTPHHPDYVNPSLCEGCSDVVVTYSTPAYTSLDQERNVTLLFANAQARPTGFLQLDVSDAGPTMDPPSRISLRLLQANGSWVTFTNGSQELFYQAGPGTMRLAAQWDASSLATGMYSYTAVVRSHWLDGATMETSVPARVLIVNERSSPYGLGWSIPGVQRLHEQTNGAAVITGGDGSAAYFVRTTCGTQPSGAYSCSYSSPAGDFSTLAYIISGGLARYVRTYPNGTTASFDAGGLQFSLTDRYGNTTAFGYSSGRLASITDPAGLVTTLGYHAGGGLAWIRDPVGRQANMVASGGILYYFTDPDGVVGLNMAFTGDRLDGFWPRGVAGSTARWDFVYDHVRRLASRTAPTVNVNGQPARPVLRYVSWEAAVLPPVGTGSSANPAPALSPTLVRAEVTDARNNTTRFALDRFGAPTRTEEPLGRTTTLARNLHSQVTLSHSPSNHYVEYRWSGPNLIRQYDETLGRVDTMMYIGNRLSERSMRASNGDVYWPAAKYHFQGLHLDSVTVYSGGFTTVLNNVPLLQPGGASIYARYQMDGRGRPTAVTDASGNTTRYYYAPGEWMNLDSVVAPGRRKTTYAYDAYGRVRAITNALGHRDSVEYDLMNRVRSAVQPGGLATRFEYGPVHLERVTDAKNQLYQFGVNALGWTETETDPLGRQDHYRFDAAGNVTRWTNRRGQHVDLTYDVLNQRTSRTADGVTVLYHTDPEGRFKTAHVPGVSTDTIRFDPRGRVLQQIGVHGGRRHVLTSSYSNLFNGQRTYLHMSAPWSRSVGFASYVTGQLHQLTDVAGGKTSVAYDERLLANAYTLPTGNTIHLRYPSTAQPAHVTHSAATLNETYGVRYRQDGLVQTVARSNALGDSLRELSYDAHGQLSGITDFRLVASPGGCLWQFDPDTGERCHNEVNRSVLGQQSFSYDAVGNRTDRSAVVGTGNRVTSFDGHTLEYDEDGNLKRKYRTTNPAAFDQHLTWNSLGQLTSVTTNGSTVAYHYNGWGELVSRSDAAGTIRYVYDGDNLFMETVDGWSEPHRVYTNYPGLDQPHSVQVWTAAAGHQVYYYATDYPGHVLGLFNTSNQVVNRYRYDPWGAAELVSEQVPNPLRYAGRYRDAATGLDYNRHRWYDSHAARFISQDPMGLAGGINPYAYTDNAPFDHTDPYGLLRIPRWVPYVAFAVTVGMSIGGGMSVGQALGGTIQAFGATAVGATAAAGLQSLASDKSFGEAFRDIFGISTTFLALGAVAGGVEEIGANGVYQGYLRTKRNLGGALTLGSAAVFGGYGRDWVHKPLGKLGPHERGHTLQFIMLSATGTPWRYYLGMGVVGRIGQQMIRSDGTVPWYGEPFLLWERMASRAGSF